MKKEAKKKNKKDLKEHKLTDWLPTTKKEVELRGWDDLDVILFSGDAYVDHPSFGPAVIGRLLEAQGLRVAIVPQPNWRDDLRDFKKLGRSTQPINVYAVKMLIHRTVVTICVPNIPALYIHRFLKNYTRMCLSSWEV